MKVEHIENTLNLYVGKWSKGYHHIETNKLTTKDVDWIRTTLE